MTPDFNLILIADRFTDETVAHKTVEAVEAGVRWVQLRDHAAAEALFEKKARAFSKTLQKVSPGVRLSVNRRLEIARALGAGFHTGLGGASVQQAKQQCVVEAPVGYSAHNLEEAQDAERAGADYVFFSPIYPTSSKPHHMGVGLQALREICKSISIPVYALGGITPEKIKACLGAGARGVAVLSGILDNPNTLNATTEYLQQFPIEQKNEANSV